MYTHTHTQKGFSKPSRPVSSKERGTVTSNRCIHENIYMYYYIVYIHIYLSIYLSIYLYNIRGIAHVQQRSPAAISNPSE